MDLFSYMLGKKSGMSAEDKEKFDLYERYFRAMMGDSVVDWNPQPIDPNETATFEEAPEKYQITVETRGITYTVLGDSIGAIIFPEVEFIKERTAPGEQYNIVTLPALNMHFFSVYHPTNEKMKTKAYVVDMSRLKPGRSAKSAFRIKATVPGIYEDAPYSFYAFPDDAEVDSRFFWTRNELNFEQGLSFGKSLHGGTANFIAYSHLDYSEKPVYVMEGFIGNLYLAKLNISAEHMLGIINNLGEGSYTLNLGSHNTEKLTAEQIAVATEKGWTVS